MSGGLVRLGEWKEPGVEHGDTSGVFWGDPRSAVLLWGGHSTWLCFSRNSTTSWISVACRHNSWAILECKSLSLMEMLSVTVGPVSMSSDRISMRRRIGRRFVGLKTVLRRPLYPYRLDHSLATDGAPFRASWMSSRVRSDSERCGGFSWVAGVTEVGRPNSTQRAQSFSASDSNFRASSVPTNSTKVESILRASTLASSRKGLGVVNSLYSWGLQAK